MRSFWHDLASLSLVTRANLTASINDRVPFECNYNKSSIIWSKNKAFGKNHLIVETNVHEIKGLMRYECLWIRRRVRVIGAGLSFIL